MENLPIALNIDPKRQPEFQHRSGWAFALDALAPLHSPNGILFDSFLERTFGWHAQTEHRLGKIPYREPWIGVLHNPPQIPDWHDVQNSPQSILETNLFQQSMPHCRGLLVLSDYLRQWLHSRVSSPVVTVTHPTEVPEIQFNLDLYFQQSHPVVVQIGWWLRKMSSIFQLQAPGHRKALLEVSHPYFRTVLERDLAIHRISVEQKRTVERIRFLKNDGYDRLLSRSVVFCDLFDSSANNTIIECIVRRTPILVNPLPAVREYLGNEYPLYFRSLQEASRKIQSPDLVVEAHEYLTRLNRGQFSQEQFRGEVSASLASFRTCSSSF